MAEPLDAELNLDTSQAQSDVAALGASTDDALVAAAMAFGDALASVTSAVPAVDLDTSAVPEQLTTAIDTGIAAADTAVPVEATGTENITSEIDAAMAAADSTFVVDADTSAAQGSVGDLGTVAADTGSAMEQAGSSGRDLGQGVDVASAAAGLAVGELGGLKEVAGGLNESLGIVAGGGIALGGIIGGLAEEGIKAESSLQRFDAVIGDMAEKVSAVDVGTLHADITKLGTEFGSTDAQIGNTASTLFQFAINSGASRNAAADFTDKIVALAARAVALNPALGSVSDVAESMGIRIARGGRFAASFGLSLTAAEIAARASADANGKAASELSIFEKAQAGANIAAERYGAVLNKDVAEGAQNAANVQKSLKAQFLDVLEALGRPLVVPLFDLMRAGIPIVTQLGGVIVTLAQAGMPLLTTVLDAILPIVTAFGQGLQAIGPGALQIIAVLGLLALAIKNIDVVLGASAAILDVNPFVLLAVGLTTAIGALGLFGGANDAASQHVQSFRDAVISANGALDDTATKAARSIFEERNQMDDLARAGITLGAALAGTAHTSGTVRDALDGLGFSTNQVIALQREHGRVITETNGHYAGNKDGIAALREEQAKWIEKIRESNPALGEQLASLSRNNDLNVGLIGTYGDLAKSTNDATTATKLRKEAGASDAQISGQQADAITKEKDARAAATKAVNDYKQALDDLLGKHLTEAEAELKQADASDKLFAAFSQQVDQTHNADQVQRGQTQAVIDYINAARDQATAVFDATNATSGAAAAQQAADGVFHHAADVLRDDLVNGFGLSTDAADALLAKLGLIPGRFTPAEAAFFTFAATAEGQMALAAGSVDIHGQQVADFAEASAQAAAFRFSEGMAGIPAAAGAATAAAGPAIVDAAAGVAATAGNEGASIGDSLGAGISRGFGGWFSNISGQVSRLIEETAAKARAAADSHSPSRVFMAIGSDLAEGLAIGMTDNADQVIRAAEALLDHAQTPFPQPATAAGGLDADALGRAFANAVGDKSGTTVVVVGSLDQARPFLPPDAQDDPRIIRLGRR